MTILTRILSSPLESGSLTPLLAAGLLFLIIVLFLSLWLSGFLRSTLLRPTMNYEQYGLSRFVSPLPFGSESSSGEGRRAEMTVFYSNIRGFSRFCEDHNDEAVLRTLQKIRVMQRDRIRELNGGVEAYIGDKVVAIFSKTDAALDACKAALRVQHSLSSHAPDHFEGLKVSIGIHTGEVIRGSAGFSSATDTTVIGDTFNAASRLCGASAAGQILISGATYELVAELVHVDGPYRLKTAADGKEEFMTVYFLKEMLDEAEE